MNRILQRHPSAALIVAIIALVAATAGTANALRGSNRVFSDDIANNTIRAQDVRRNALTGADIRNNSIRGFDVKTNSLKGTDIQNGSIHAADLRKGVVPSFAVVGANGALGRNRDAISAARRAVGRYTVTFNRRDLGGCAYIAQVAGINAQAPPTGHAAATRLPAYPRTIVVHTRNAAGKHADRNFHLIVTC